MALPPARMRRFVPVSDQASSVNYHQLITWKITEEAWNSDEHLLLELGTKIPGTVNVEAGGYIRLSRENQRWVGFASYWPKEVKEENVNIETIFRMKKGSEVCFVLKDMDYRLRRRVDQNCNVMFNKQSALLLPNPTELNLYDENKAFSLEAEILIVKKNPEVFDSVNAPCQFLLDMKSIMKLEDISDLKIVCCGKVFKCHKTILCARSVVFKNMLSGETRENLSREIIIEDSSAEVVEEMLKHIYTGEIPDKLDALNFDLLYLAEKYLLDPLKFACGWSIVNSLTISTCFSSFITVERYFPSDSSVRKAFDVFLRNNAEQVIESEDWDGLVMRFPKQSRGLVRAMIKGGKE